MKSLRYTASAIIFIAFSCSKEVTTPTPTMYTLSVSAGTGGAVSTQGGSYESGSTITITATPNGEYSFSGWSNGSTENPLTITLTSNQSLQANFEIDCSALAEPQTDWTKKSYDLFNIEFPTNGDGSLNENMLNIIGGNYEYGFGGAFIDYNNDGFKDIVGFRNNYENFVDYPQGYTGYERKQQLRFYLGSCDKTFTIDEKNDSKYLGLVHGRKFLYGDFNNDGKVDFFLVGHGYDKQPFPGEFLKVLMSNSDGSYTETEFSDVSFFHGGATGDFDNDGDLDVFVTDAGRGYATIYVNNNGTLVSNKSLIDQSMMEGMYNSELFDVNKDGFLDLIVGAHDWKYNSTTYDNTPYIIYGDGIDFVGNSNIRLPETGVPGQGIESDFNFYDLNNNGNYEIIIARTGDNKDDNNNFYKGWSIQVLELEGNDYVDSTSKFITSYVGQLNDPWIKWLDIRDIDHDGVMEMTNAQHSSSNLYLEWELVNGKFERKH